MKVFPKNRFEWFVTGEGSAVLATDPNLHSRHDIRLVLLVFVRQPGRDVDGQNRGKRDSNWTSPAGLSGCETDGKMSALSTSTILNDN